MMVPEAQDPVGHGEGPWLLPAGQMVAPAAGDELNQVLELGRLVWRDTYGPIAGDDYVEMGLSKWWTADAVMPAMRLGRVLVAHETSDPSSPLVGLASWGAQAGEAVLWRCYVHPKAQGSGIGRALFTAVAVQAKERGYTRLTLSYLLANTQARLFYEAMGFTETTRENEDSPLPASVWCALDLTSWEPRQW